MLNYSVCLRCHKESRKKKIIDEPVHFTLRWFQEKTCMCPNELPLGIEEEPPNCCPYLVEQVVSQPCHA